MFSARRLACCGLALASCLAAPPDGEPLPPDDEMCSSILRDRFDDNGVWDDYEEPGASVDRAPDGVHIVAEPVGGEGSAYGDLHSQAMIQADGTELTATLAVLDGEGAVAGISWTSYGEDGEADDDYHDLVIADGAVAPAYKRAGGERVTLCGTSCPAYQPSLHARLRMRATGGEVVYQAAPADGPWVELARAPLGEPVYRAVASAWAGAPGTGELAVSEMEWADCE